MVRAGDNAAIATLYSHDTPEAGSPFTLGSDVAAHLRVLRLQPGSNVRITDGRGTIATAVLRKVGKDMVHVDISDTSTVEREAEVHALVPVADKDRMLWLAEKSVELGLTSWRPVAWKRSRGVASRGEGTTFRRRLHARMTSALEQSGGAWLPDIFPESTVDRAVAASPDGTRVVLNPRADRAFPISATGAAVVVIGPEGGMETDELEMFTAAGFVPVRVAANMMRFETAALAGIVLARAALARGPTDGGGAPQ